MTFLSLVNVFDRDDLVLHARRGVGLAMFQADAGCFHLADFIGSDVKEAAAATAAKATTAAAKAAAAKAAATAAEAAAETLAATAAKSTAAESAAAAAKAAAAESTAAKATAAELCQHGHAGKCFGQLNEQRDVGLVLDQDIRFRCILGDERNFDVTCVHGFKQIDPLAGRLGSPLGTPFGLRKGRSEDHDKHDGRAGCPLGKLLQRHSKILLPASCSVSLRTKPPDRCIRAEAAPSRCTPACSEILTI